MDQKQRNGNLPLISEISPKQRKGKWTTEEEEYAQRMITYFNLGLLRVQQGMTLRAYLSEKLHCDPMRITKKFTAENCIGKQVYVAPVHDEKSMKKAEVELKKLERQFILRLMSRERSRVMKRTLQSSEMETGKVLKTSSSFIPSFTDKAPDAEVGHQRVNSAPDLSSLEKLSKTDDMIHTEQMDNKATKIPRSRSTSRFQDLDDNEGARLLLEFSEKMREEYANKLQADKKCESDNTNVNLPNFFTSEAIAMEAAKYNSSGVFPVKTSKPTISGPMSSNMLGNPFISLSHSDECDPEVEERIPFTADKTWNSFSGEDSKPIKIESKFQDRDINPDRFGSTLSITKPSTFPFHQVAIH